MIGVLTAALRSAGTIFRSLGAKIFSSFKGKKGFFKSSKNLKKFKKDLAREIDNIIDEGMRYNRKIAKEVFADVVRATPVDTGFMASKWSHTINRKPPATKVYNPRNGSHSPAPTPTFLSFGKGDVIYIFNPTVYAERIENGWSKQAPRNFSKKIIRKGDRKLQGYYNRIK